MSTASLSAGKVDISATPKSRWTAALPPIAWILVLATVLRFASIVVLRSFMHPNTWEFGPPAAALLHGEGYVYAGVLSAYMPPGYGFLLAGFLRAFGANPQVYLFLEILQGALGVLLVYLVFLLAVQLYSARTALAAALLATLYPPFIQACNEFHPISFYIVLGTAVVFFLVKAVQVPEKLSFVIYSGLCLGCLVLFRAEAVGLAIVFAIFLALQRRSQSLVRAAVFLGIVFAIMLPWTVRNHRIFHAFIPISTSGPLNLWIGNNPNATGSDRAKVGYVQFSMPPAMLAELQAIPHLPDNEIQQGKVYNRETISYITSHPGHEITLALRKFILFWTFDPNHDKGRKPAYWVPSVLLSLAALLGLLAEKSRHCASWRRS